MFFAVWDFIFSRSSFKSVLPMAFTCAVQTSTGASRRANRAGLQLRWCRSPTRPPKLHTRPHRGEFGFCLLAGASQEDLPPFRQSRVRNRAEEKTPLPHFSEMEPVKSVIPCKRFFKPSGVKSFSLFMRRKFCGGIPVRKELSRLTFSPYKAANPACPGPGSNLSPQSLAGTAHPTLSCSNLYATASWMGRIVYRSTPFFTLPSLPWTVVFSVSMSLFSSNRCTFFRTVLGLIPVHWPIRLKLGQH